MTTSITERLESLAPARRDRIRLLSIYRRMPEVGGALIPGERWPTAVTWCGGEIIERAQVWCDPGPTRIEPLSPAWVVCNASYRRRPMLMEWARGADARIRAEASAAGMEPPLSGYCLVYVHQRTERVWLVEGLAIAKIENSNQHDALSFPYEFVLLPGAHVTLYTSARTATALAKEIAEGTGVPLETALDYLRGRLPRTAWEAEVAVARLAGGGER